jgi:anaerobic ribonucleoside-triphosphate reductase
MTEKEQGIYNKGRNDGAAKIGRKFVSMIEKLTLAQTKANQEIIKLITDDIEREHNHQAIVASLAIAIDMIIESCLYCPGEERCHHDHEDKEKCRVVILGMIEEKQREVLKTYDEAKLSR